MNKGNYETSKNNVMLIKNKRKISKNQLDQKNYFKKNFKQKIGICMMAHGLCV